MLWLLLGFFSALLALIFSVFFSLDKTPNVLFFLAFIEEFCKVIVIFWGLGFEDFSFVKRSAKKNFARAIFFYPLFFALGFWVFEIFLSKKIILFPFLVHWITALILFVSANFARQKNGILAKIIFILFILIATLLHFFYNASLK